MIVTTQKTLLLLSIICVASRVNAIFHRVATLPSQPPSSSSPFKRIVPFFKLSSNDNAAGDDGCASETNGTNTNKWESPLSLPHLLKAAFLRKEPENEEILRIHDALGRASIQLTAGFLAFGAISAFFPELPCWRSFKLSCKQWSNEVKVFLRNLLIKSDFFTNKCDGDSPTVLSVPSQYVIFALSSIEAIYGIITGEPAIETSDGTSALSISGFLYIVRVHLFPPRYLFILGCGLRMIQTCTKLQYHFNPSIGVCALTNLGSIAGRAKWIDKIIFGWTISGPVWRLFGAETPQS